MTANAREGVDGFLHTLLGDDLTHPDPVIRYQACTQVQDLLTSAAVILGEVRKAALAELEDGGMPRETIARTVGGLSRQRVGQILGPKAPRPAEE